MKLRLTNTQKSCSLNIAFLIYCAKAELLHLSVLSPMQIVKSADGPDKLRNFINEAPVRKIYVFCDPVEPEDSLLLEFTYADSISRSV
ncbi:MAG: hypothetical protein K0R49_1377 [Burkholderiales bacterium]|nr:hypothetical protein [Burkholderiales bacterium]